MANLFEHLAARLAYAHARTVYARFRTALDDVARTQQRVLARVLATVAGSDFARTVGLHRVTSVATLRRTAPLSTYEDYRTLIQRLADGDRQALFAPRTRLHMFATSSGTTAEPKRIPVTDAFVRDYRRGWNTFGLKMLSDHPDAVLRAILQSSGRYDAQRTSAGIPCGAITGLLARTQKGIVRRYYVGRPQIAQLSDPNARYYTLMRLGLARDVAFAITANPATLIQMARTADEHSERLIRDIHDGTLSACMVPDPALRRLLSARLRPQPARADALAAIRRRVGTLRPRDCWRLSFLACWTGGSLGHYLERLAEWWGPVPVRDVGLLASEGRVSIPLQDNTPVGVLDVTSAVFEFIPIGEQDDATPATLLPHELEVGRDYIVVLTNTTGLVRYRLDDVVRVRGRLGQAPQIEFLHRAGRVASVAGEKLTEHQAVAAVRAACQVLGKPAFDFVLAPRWSDPPFYRLSCVCPVSAGLAGALDAALADQNEEYASRRKSRRLGPLQVRQIPAAALTALDDRILAQRSSAAEQYKRPCLLSEPDGDDFLVL